MTIQFSASVRPLTKLTNTDRVSRYYYQEGLSLPLTNSTPFDGNSIHEYERTPRLPLTATSIGCYDDMFIRNPRSPLSKVDRVCIDFQHLSGSINLVFLGDIGRTALAGVSITSDTAHWDSACSRTTMIENLNTNRCVHRKINVLLHR